MKVFHLLLTAAGFGCVALGGIGLFVPLMPTTPFLLLGGFCLSRGSRRHHDWLVSQSWYQQYVAGYTNGEGVPLRAKILTLTMLWGAIALSVLFFIDPFWVKLLLLAIAGAVTLLLVRLPTQRCRHALS